ncbi:transcriptional regulator MarR family [Vibrio ponticus]|nr:transcriptional regulator MarR family [Vibrio ponticus]
MKDLTEISHLMDTLNIVADKISAYGKISRPYGTEDSLLVHEVHIIDYIGRHDIVTASDIVSVTYKTKGAISQTLNKLAELGLIDRTEHPDDKRKQRLILTEKGMVVFDHHKEKDLVAYSRYQSRLEGVSDEDLRTANAIIKTIFKL